MIAVYFLMRAVVLVLVKFSSASRRIFLYFFKFKIFLQFSTIFLHSSSASIFSTVLHPLFCVPIFLLSFFPFFSNFLLALSPAHLFFLIFSCKIEYQAGFSLRMPVPFLEKQNMLFLFFKNSVFRAMILQNCPLLMFGQQFIVLC